MIKKENERKRNKIRRFNNLVIGVLEREKKKGRIKLRIKGFIENIL